MPADRPYFIPKNIDLGQLPGGLRKAVDDIILPAYQEFVLEATTSLERAAGMTLCCHIWLELLEQFDLGR